MGKNKFIFLSNMVFLLFLFVLCGCDNGNSATTNISNPKLAIQNIIQQYVESYATANGFSAVSITTQCNGFNNSQPFTVFAGTMGYASVDPRIVKSNSLWQIGSNSKSFASIVLLQLEAESQYKFSLDDHLTKWLPEYNYYTWLSGDISPTVRQLMNMTSGIPDDATDVWRTYYLENLNSFMSPESAIAAYAGDSLQFQPGSAWLYSNTGYNLLGLLIERITGHSANVEITNRIITKLGLKNTYFIDNLPTDFVESNQLVHGYYESRVNINIGKDVSLGSLSGTFFTAGNIISTTEDINLYYRALFTTNQLLDSRQFQELSTFVSETTGQPLESPADADNGFGYGLGIEAFNLAKYNKLESSALQNDQNLLFNIDKYSLVYDYPGGTPGFGLFYFYNPVNSASVIITVNSNKGGSNIQLVAFSVLNQLDPICQTH